MNSIRFLNQISLIRMVGIVAITVSTVVFGVVRTQGGTPCILEDNDVPCPCCPGHGPGPVGDFGPNGWPGADGGGGGDCPTCEIGMPGWRVSEPFINLWINDEPLGYEPSRGPRVSLNLAYQQRATNGAIVNVFSAGRNWHFSWFSYLEQPSPLSGETFLVHFPGGGARQLGPSTPDYQTRTRVEMVVTNNTTNAYKVFYPNGSLDVYDFIVTNSSGAFQQAFLTQRIDSTGNTNRLLYDSYLPAAPIVRLKYLVDMDNRTNTIHYVTNNSFSTNLISHVVDGYGRVAYLRYDNQGLLTNIVDVAGISSSFAYETNRWITNLTTPYGATSFAYTDGTYVGESAFPNNRSVTVIQPNGAKHFYLYRDGLNTAFSPSTEVPSTTNSNYSFANTFDITTHEDQNTFYWNPRQYEQLSTNYLYTGELNNLTTNDYLRSYLKHWMKLNNVPHLSPTISMERTPSPDGSSEGQKTWYDYYGKEIGHPDVIGTKNLPLFVAMTLPDGTVRFVRTLRNGLGNVTNKIATYTRSDGTVGVRTNIYTYAANEIDLLTVVGPESVREMGYAYNGNHQVTFATNALNEVTSFTYDAATHLLTSRKTPAGLTTTNLYGGDGRLEKAIDLEISRTNSFTYQDGLVRTHTDSRGLMVTNTWDALQRLLIIA